MPIIMQFTGGFIASTHARTCNYAIFSLASHLFNLTQPYHGKAITCAKKGLNKHAYYNINTIKPAFFGFSWLNNLKFFWEVFLRALHSFAMTLGKECFQVSVAAPFLFSSHSLTNTSKEMNT